MMMGAALTSTGTKQRNSTEYVCPMQQCMTPTFQEKRCHMVSHDVKMEDFQRKARLVAGGHMSKVTSATTTYASVVSTELVRIVLILAALNNLDAKMLDIENAI